MTHAENRRSAVRKIRGMAYALTQHLDLSSNQRAGRAFIITCEVREAMLEPDEVEGS